MGGGPGLPILFLALRFTGHKWAVSLENGWGAPGEGNGRKVPERGGLKSLSRAALHDVPCMTSQCNCAVKDQNFLHRYGRQAFQVSLWKEDSSYIELPKK